jgi:hypothetical protein
MNGFTFSKALQVAITPRLMAVYFLLVIQACDRPASLSLPEEYLGQWYYTGSGGGIDGKGMGDEATGYIIIHADGTVEVYRDDDSLVNKTAFTVVRDKTIFSSENCWMLRPEGGAPSQVILVSEDGLTMSLQENVYDGFGRSYSRSR